MNSLMPQVSHPRIFQKKLKACKREREEIESSEEREGRREGERERRERGRGGGREKGKE